MLGSLLGVMDRLLATLLLAGARRSWPVLRLLPSSWIRRLLAPTARRMRRSLARGVLWLSLAVGVLVVLFAAGR
jgi:hypothetical protein